MLLGLKSQISTAASPELTLTIIHTWPLNGKVPEYCRVRLHVWKGQQTTERMLRHPLLLFIKIWPLWLSHEDLRSMEMELYFFTSQQKNTKREDKTGSEEKGGFQWATDYQTVQNYCRSNAQKSRCKEHGNILITISQEKCLSNQFNWTVEANCQHYTGISTVLGLGNWRSRSSWQTGHIPEICMHKESNTRGVGSENRQPLCT